jgi:hypothetical protein
MTKWRWKKASPFIPKKRSPNGSPPEAGPPASSFLRAIWRSRRAGFRFQLSGFRFQGYRQIAAISI